MRYDPLSPAERTERMRRVRGADTSTELAVRRLIFSMGYRYRLHRRDLPGAPDLVFAGTRKVIFVHGCFWHLHDCGNFRLPKSRPEYWLPKLQRNAERDRSNENSLKGLGWEVLTVWECQLRDPASVSARIATFLDS
jgi:DNA mismatch endonuclease (patch repair protein)